MRIQDLKFWQLAKNVLIRCFIFTSFLNFCCAQQNNRYKEIKKDTELNGQEIASNVISKIVLKDTITQGFYSDFLEKQVKDGKITIEQKESFLKEKKNSAITVYKKLENEFAIKILEDILKKEGKLIQYFGKNKVEQFIRNPPKEMEISEQSLDPIIKITSDPSINPIHLFSAPFKIDKTKWLIYHDHIKGRLNGYSEFIIYEILPDNSFRILNIFPVSIS